MAARARSLLERIQPPISNTNDILGLTVRGDDAIATVRQKFNRMLMIQGSLHAIYTEVTQRETWTRTPAGWKLLFVDKVRDHLTLDSATGALLALTAPARGELIPSPPPPSPMPRDMPMPPSSTR